MAPITKSLALAGAFFALTGYSAPVAKRAVVWETVTDIVWTTVDVTTTVYPNSAPTVTAAVVSTTSAAAIVTPTETPDETSDETSEETPDVKQTVVVPSSSTPESTPAPAAEADTSSAAPAPAPTEESSAVPVPAPTTSIVDTATARSSNPDTASSTASSTAPSSTPSTTPSTGYNGACSEGAPCDGMITFYDTATLATNPSSCGTTNDGTSEDVLALPVGIMKDGDCGKTVTITYKGQTATGKVVDKCMGCDNTSIDLSRALFGKLASFDRGRVSGAKWFIH